MKFKYKYSFCYVIKNRTHYINRYKDEEYEINNFINSVNKIKNVFDDEDVYEIIIVDFKSTDTDYSWFKNSIKNNKIIIIDEEFFNKGMGLNIGSEKCKNEIIFFIDSDMLISEELIIQSEELLEKKEAFFPICYSYSTPNNDIGSFRPTGFGNVIIKKHFYMDKKLKWVERESWGFEDSNFYFNIKSDSVRENGINFFHLWHSDNDEFKMKYWKYKNWKYDGGI